MTRFLQIIIFSLLFVPLFGQKSLPPLNNQRVHDEAGVLSQSTIGFLEQKLKSFEDSTSNQIAILIVSSLEGQPIEDFGIKLAKDWKLGTAGNDNGIIIIVAINDRKMRIEVGHGLEGALPDAIANRIIRNEMAPYFRRGDYDGGIVASTDAVIAATKGEYKSDGRSSRSGGKGGFPVWLIFFIIVALISMFSKNNRRPGSGWSSGGGWFLGGGGGRGWGGGGGGGFSGGGGSFGGGGSSGSW